MTPKKRIERTNRFALLLERCTDIPMGHCGGFIDTHNLERQQKFIQRVMRSLGRTTLCRAERDFAQRN